ncbi:MAG: hypothetical protein ACE5F1_19005 [Planctomycetota bacterium]
MSLTLGFWLPFALHLGLALVYRFALGISIDEGIGIERWEEFWQTLPMASLCSDLAQSLWNLHAQPPLFNLYGAFFGRTFGAEALDYMHVANILLGSVLSGMVYVVGLECCHRKALAFAVSMAIALHPALFLYEAYVLYTLLAAFLVVAAMFCLARFAASGRRAWLAAFVLCINVLILTRSVFHPVLLLLCIPLVCVLAGPRWRTTLAMSLAISCLSIGWYAKNLVKFGTFEGSSWSGMALWKAATRKYSRKEIAKLADQGVLDRVVSEVPVYSRPSAYVKFGFDLRSDVASLSRDDYHNINMIRISRLYLRNALRLIRHDPILYLAMLGQAFRTFCRPSSSHVFLDGNARRIDAHVTIGAGILQGEWVAKRVRAMLGGKGDFGSFLILLIPSSVLVYLASCLRTCGSSLGKWICYLRSDAVMALGSVLIAYTTLVCCCLEYGENNRFKFMVEPLLWVFIVTVFYRVYERRVREKGESPAH